MMVENYNLFLDSNIFLSPMDEVPSLILDPPRMGSFISHTSRSNQGRQVPGAGAGGLAPPFSKRSKIRGAAPSVSIKNDAQFKGILILVYTMCCK